MSDPKDTTASNLDQAGQDAAVKQKVASKLVDSMSKEVLDDIAGGLSGHIDRTDHWNASW
jgi:hypothetical protein